MSKTLTFQCHLKNTIRDVFLSRGYIEIPECDDEEEEETFEWDFIWASRAWIHNHMLGATPLTLKNNQRVNHFPNSFELTRKDLMAKNLMKLSRELRKTGQEATVDFFPQTFVLPNDFIRFRQEMKGKNCVWIAKPVGGSQGMGIVFIQNEQEAVKFNNTNSAKFSAAETPEDRMRYTYVVQRYIANPFLVGGRKFDIRLYALVLSYSPLIVYIYRGGFCRFSSQPYTTKSFDRDVHLTNIAVQTHSEAYNPRHGCKWDTHSLRTYFIHRYGSDATNTLFTAIQGIILNSLLSVLQAVIPDKHCYELYGYDIMIADDLRPWLIEINASPSLDANTEDDYDMKFSMLNEMLDLVQMKQRKEDGSDLPLHYGGFDLSWHNGPVVSKCPTNCTSYLGCHCPIKGSPNNPYRSKESKFVVKRIPAKKKKEVQEVADDKQGEEKDVK